MRFYPVKVTVELQLIRDMTENRYLIFAALSVGLITIGILVFMR